LNKNDIIRTEIGGWGEDGGGICRIDGMAVFVSGGVPGDVCDIRILKPQKSYAFAKIERLLTPSPLRTGQDCAEFPKCGGCTLRHVSYEAELDYKSGVVRDALRRIGGLDITPMPIIPAPSLIRYRNKAIYQISDLSGSLETGFYRSGSHDIVAVKKCLLQEPGADEAAEAFMRYAAAVKLSAYNEKTGKGIVRRLMYRSAADGKGQLCISVTDPRALDTKRLVDYLLRECPWLSGILLDLNKDEGNTAIRGNIRVLWGEEKLRDKLCGLDFLISPRSFFQVNRAQTERLYAEALRLAALDGSERVLDLYCGIGTISLCVATATSAGAASMGAAKSVLGVEIVPEAVADAVENAKLNGITNAEFICADAETAAQRAEETGERPDVIFVDPPRKGLSSGTVSASARMRPDRIVYVSCNPATLARDLKLFAELGYAVREAQPVDMFPRTSHVETCVLLSHKNPQTSPPSL